ncbi:MAG TPA: YggS family pyridoxal phosphate-dependent enzyme [Candidatus Binataceae bacterium]|nr:YggS family pyridoxal phosphate-dependent enzyme [Candidatus Binataceae bacterium]
MLSSHEIAARLAEVRDRASGAARRARRDPGAIRIVLASKAQPPEAIRAAYAAGAREVGENYVQEAAAKQDALADLPDLRWHLIGHLQTNKAREAARRFALIHSLDSARVAAALARARPERRVPVLIEVNAADEATKRGVAADAVEPLLLAVRESVEVVGLMTIPPPAPAAEGARRYFAALRATRDRLAARTGLALSELSMGMTDDFEVAIEEGATIVRIGRAVFGERGR